MADIKGLHGAPGLGTGLQLCSRAPAGKSSHMQELGGFINVVLLVVLYTAVQSNLALFMLLLSSETSQNKKG